MKALAIALLVLAGAAGAQASSDGESDAERRYHALIGELRCAVCQNQSIAESNAPLAADLREQVRAQIAAGRSDAEIVDFLTARYGDFIRYRPAFKLKTLLLWLGPFLLLLLTASIAALFIRRSRSLRAAPAPDRERLQRLLDEEQRR